MKFTTGEVISAGLGKLCCPIERVYAVMNFLTGDNLFTHQLPRAFHACEPWVKKQHPWLLDLDQSSCNKDTWRAWLQAVESKVGTEHELIPLPSGQWKPCDPIQEAVELMEGRENVIVVQH